MGAEHRRILVVDDDPHIRAMLRRVLEHAGSESQAVATGTAALTALAAGSYHLVLTDFHLPDMSGADLLHRVQQRHPQLPTLLMSGMPWAHLDAVVQALPWVGFLAKPFMLHEVQQILQQAVQRPG